MCSLEMGIIIPCAIRALDSDSRTGAGFELGASLPHLLEMCRIFILCAGHATNSALKLWNNEFCQLTLHLKDALRLISYPARYVNVVDVFRAQCALDMAMRLHVKRPGVIDRTFFRELHERSVKIYDLASTLWPAPFYRSWTQTDDAAGGVLMVQVDWEKVFREKKYVGFRIPDDVINRDVWYHEDLQSSCKERIRCMWSYLCNNYEAEFRSILDEFKDDAIPQRRSRC